MPKPPGNVHALRRAATRERIVSAGRHLFETRGYEATSISEISDAAGVAARTIYLHFDSKAAILLAYFDDWVDQYVAAVCSGPANEDLDEAMIRSFAVLDIQGEIDRRSFAEMGGVEHPVLEILLSRNLDITGHVLHTWVRAQNTLAEHFRHSLALPTDSVVPRARAAAVFGAWMATLLAYRDGLEGRSSNPGPLHEIAIEVARAYGSGLNNRPSMPD